MTKTFTERDIHRNMRSVAHAIAQQELEGLKVPASTVAFTVTFSATCTSRPRIGSFEESRIIARTPLADVQYA
jgi:hypothetical protein